MNIAQGDRVEHEQEGAGTVQRVGVGPKGDLLDVLFDDGCGMGRFVEQSKITSLNGSPVVVARERKFSPAVLCSLPPEFLNFLRVNEQKVHIRLHWGKDCEDHARKNFRELGIESVTDEIRPLNSEQWAIAGVVDFPLPPSFLMKNLDGFTVHQGKDFVRVNSKDLAVSLIKAGFPADRSAKYDKD